MVKGCNCVACRGARLISRFKVARGWKERDAEKGEVRK